MLERQEIVLEPQETTTKENKPTLTKWKGEPMIRVHSIKATVKEILQVSKALDVVKVGIVGEPSTGKTTLAKLLAHLVHKVSDVPFAVRVFGEEEFLNMKQTLADLKPANYILIFDDLSFLSNRTKIEEVKQVITKIRHLPGGQDVKIILIYDYHYTLGLDKYLRQANFRYFTSVGSSEDDNMIKIVGGKYQDRVKEFQEKFVEMTTKFKCTFRIGGNKYFAYNYKNPFVPCLFYNNSRLRYVIFPLREWIDPICSICSEASGKLMHSQIPVDQFVRECEEKFGRGHFEAAVKLSLFSNGLNVYANKVVAAKRYFDKAREKKLISLEEVATHYGFEITVTKLRKKLDGVLAE